MTIKGAIMQQHARLVKAGNYEEARMLFRFLRNNYISLGLDDVSTCIELYLTSIGLNPIYSRNYMRASFALYEPLRKVGKI